VEDEFRYSRSLATGAMDRMLLEAAWNRHSYDEMSRLTHGTLSPEQCAQRVQTMLTSHDWATYFQQKLLFMEELNALKAEVWKWAKSGDDKAVGNLIKILGMIQRQLEHDNLDIEAAAQRITDGNAAIMLAAFERALNSMAESIAAKYGDTMIEGEVVELALEALPAAVEYVEARREQVEY